MTKFHANPTETDMTASITREQFLGALLGLDSYWGRKVAESLASLPGTPAEEWAACRRGDVLLAAAAQVGVDRRTIALAACAAARPALGCMSAKENQPRLAIEAAEAWARREKGATLRRARMAAGRSARFGGSGPHAIFAAASAAAHAARAAFAAAGAPHAAFAASCAADALAYGAYDHLVSVRRQTLAASADVVRQHIPWSVVEAALAKRRSA